MTPFIDHLRRDRGRDHAFDVKREKPVGGEEGGLEADREEDDDPGEVEAEAATTGATSAA